MDAIALHDDAFHLPGLRAYRAHAGIHVHADLPARAVGGAIASPPADVVVLDDDIVRAGQQANRILLRAFQRQAAHDDVGRRDGDVVLLGVAAIDGGFSGIQHITLGRAALSDVQRLRAAAHFHGPGDWKALVPGARIQARTAELDFVLRARFELHQAAAAFRVARIEPERQAFAPRALAGLAELDPPPPRAPTPPRSPVTPTRSQHGDGSWPRRQRGGGACHGKKKTPKGDTPAAQ